MGDGRDFNRSGFPSVILTKGVRGFHSVGFLHFITTSRANQSTGRGSEQLWDRLRLTTKQSFPAERITEPWNRLPEKKDWQLQMPLLEAVKNSSGKTPPGVTQVIVFPS